MTPFFPSSTTLTKISSSSNPQSLTFSLSSLEFFTNNPLRPCIVRKIGFRYLEILSNGVPTVDNGNRHKVKHGVRTTFRPGRNLKELRKQSQCPLGDKRKAVVYRIPFGCDEAVYVVETYDRQFETRKKEHERKVRLTRQDIEKGRIDSAERRMGKEDGGLASHSIKCEKQD